MVRWCCFRAHASLQTIVEVLLQMFQLTTDLSDNSPLAVQQEADGVLRSVQWCRDR